MSFTDLPQEIVQEIVEYCRYADRKSLKSCALTCRLLSTCARAVLFRIVSLNCTRFRDPTLFSNLINSNPEIGRYVKWFYISQPETWTGYPDPHFLPHFLPWPSFPNLRKIQLMWLRFRTMNEFFLIMDAIPTLEDLSCDQVIWTACEDPGIHAARALESEGSSAFPILKNLKIHIQGGKLVPRSFVRHLQCRRDTVPLQSVALHQGSDSMDNYLGWTELLRMASPTLLKASLYTSEMVTHRNSHETLFASLQTCSSLRELTLGYRFQLRADPQSAVHGRLLEALCVYVETIPPPHADLEQLCLRMFDRDGAMISVTPALGARLARALLDRTRYPRFCRLTVVVKAQTWSNIAGYWQGLLDYEAERPVVERWEHAFGAFKSAPGVQLDVSARGWLY